MGRSQENQRFRCAHCARHVEPLTNGSYRNHCPFCLWSRHVDESPGDRAAACRGMMRPVALRHSRKGWQLVHKCERCGATRVNRIATDTDQPDEIDPIIELMQVTVDLPPA